MITLIINARYLRREFYVLRVYLHAQTNTNGSIFSYVLRHVKLNNFYEIDLSRNVVDQLVLERNCFYIY